MKDENRIIVSNIFEPYLGEEVTKEKVEAAYREAFFDVHPDHGGTQEEFVAINEDRQRLLEEEGMKDGVTYRVVLEESESSDQQRNELYTGLRDYWEQGLGEANYREVSDYQIVTYREIEDKVISRFEDSSDLSFAINAEISGELFTHETNYFAGGEKVNSFKRSRFSYEVFDSESYLQEIPMNAVGRAEALKSENEEFFDSV